MDEPRSRPRQSPLHGVNRNGLLNSFHADRLDAARGRLVSSAIDAQLGDRIFARVGGGDDGVRLRLRDAGGRVLDGVLTGEKHERLRPGSLSVGEATSVRVEIIDEATGSWGHLLVQDVLLVRPVD